MKSKFLTPNGEITRAELAELLSVKHKVDVKTALRLMRTCEEEEEISEDSPMNHYHLLEEACKINAYTDGDIETLDVQVVPASEGTEQSILDAAINSRLDNSYSRLSERFDFGEYMTQFKPRDGTIPTPEDYAAAIGLGVDMSSKGMWLAGDGIANLMRMGHENVVHQIAASLRMSYSAVSNWHRTAQRIPAHKRHAISPTVAQEIATAKFSEDEKENNEVIDRLIDQARKEGWSSSEARSHVRMERGMEPQQRLDKSSTSWLKEFGGAEELLIIAAKSILSQSGRESYHFAETLNKIFHRLTDPTQKALRSFIKDMLNEQIFDEDTEFLLKKYDAK